MRTTIDLPDGLVRAARVRAAESDETLKELFTRALTRELRTSTTKRRGELPLIQSARRGSLKISPGELEQALIDDDVDRLS